MNATSVSWSATTSHFVYRLSHVILDFPKNIFVLEANRSQRRATWMGTATKAPGGFGCGLSA